MNDPGLDAAVTDNAAHLDQPAQYDKEDEEETEEDYLTPR